MEFDGKVIAVRFILLKYLVERWQLS